MFHVGEVTLPDGRVVHGRVVSSREWDTNATNIISVDLEWVESGEPLTGDEYNEDFGGAYLHELVTDALLLLPGEMPADILSE